MFPRTGVIITNHALALAHTIGAASCCCRGYQDAGHVGWFLAAAPLSLQHLTAFI